jgi:hypothetical protein
MGMRASALGLVLVSLAALGCNLSGEGEGRPDLAEPAAGEAPGTDGGASTAEPVASARHADASVASPPPVPPPFDGDCTGDRCLSVTCPGPLCNGTCPLGRPCSIACNDDKSCPARIDCTASPCVVACVGDHACEGLELACGGGPCFVNCTGDHSCMRVPAANNVTASCIGRHACHP